eukprot:366564-Chlamydomonas_euryale.AAC.4
MQSGAAAAGGADVDGFGALRSRRTEVWAARLLGDSGRDGLPEPSHLDIVPPADVELARDGLRAGAGAATPSPVGGDAPAALFCVLLEGADGNEPGSVRWRCSVAPLRGLVSLLFRLDFLDSDAAAAGRDCGEGAIQLVVRNYVRGRRKGQRRRHARG